MVLSKAVINACLINLIGWVCMAASQVFDVFIYGCIMNNE